MIKVTDIQTGAYTYRVLPINGTPATGALVSVPDAISLTGPNGTTCGSGSVDVLVFDGQAPYTAACPNSQIFVLNNSSNTQPGKFTFVIGQSATCLTNEQCVITDNTGARVILPVTTVKGTDPDRPDLAVAPSAITLTCGAAGSVTVVGGTGSYSANSTHPRVTATVSGNTVTITRLAGPDPAGGPFPPSATISITDGASVVAVTATVPPACP